MNACFLIRFLLWNLTHCYTETPTVDRSSLFHSFYCKIHRNETATEFSIARFQI